MAICPAGHDSAAADYCDLCGIRMGSQVMAPVAPGPGMSSAPDFAHSPGPPCPRCGESGFARFCESCGYPLDESTGQQPTVAADSGLVLSPCAGEDRSASTRATTWTAVVTASRIHYDSVIAAAGPDASQVRFPDDCPERRFALAGSQVRIGRRSVTKEVVPEIDLTGPPADPGISRLHAILVSQPDGLWSVIDPGSANGTTVNDVEIMPGETVQLGDGDRIGIGAWTLITIVAHPSYVEGNLRNGDLRG